MTRPKIAMDDFLTSMQELEPVQLSIVFTYLTEHIIKDEELMKQINKVQANWLYGSPPPEKFKFDPK